MIWCTIKNKILKDQYNQQHWFPCTVYIMMNILAESNKFFHFVVFWLHNRILRTILCLTKQNYNENILHTAVFNTFFHYSLNILFIIIHLSNSCAEINKYIFFVLSLAKKLSNIFFKKKITLSQLATWFNRVYISISEKWREKSSRKGGVTPSDCIPSDIGTAPSNSDKVLYWYLGYLTRHLFGLFALIVKTQQDRRQNVRETAPHLGRDKPLLTKRGWHVNKRRHEKVLQKFLSLDCMC